MIACRQDIGSTSDNPRDRDFDLRGRHGVLFAWRPDRLLFAADRNDGGNRMTFTPPYVSALTAGLLIVTQMVLMLSVVMARRRNRQSVGDGGHHELLLAIRRHGNFAENAAIFVAGFALLELVGGSRTTLAIMCTAFVLGRMSHAIGLSMKQTVNPFRVGGAAMTAFVGVSLGLRLIAIAARHLWV
jgi:hypothetical protein